MYDNAIYLTFFFILFLFVKFVKYKKYARKYFFKHTNRCFFKCQLFWLIANPLLLSPHCCLLCNHKILSTFSFLLVLSFFTFLFFFLIKHLEFHRQKNKSWISISNYFQVSLFVRLSNAAGKKIFSPRPKECIKLILLVQINQLLLQK